jgi:hypothetical protein
MADNDNVLESGETLEIKIIDYRDGTGEWANCRKCGAAVFRPKAISSDNPRIVCACGAVALECAVFAVRLRRLPDASAGIDMAAILTRKNTIPEPTHSSISESVAMRTLLKAFVKNVAPNCKPGGWEYDHELAELCEETARLLGMGNPWKQ